MKRLLLLLAVGILISTSGFAYTIYHNNYNGSGTPGDMDYHEVHMTTPAFWVRLHAMRTQDLKCDEYCYASVSSWDPNFYESASTYYKGTEKVVEKWVWVGSTSYTMTIMLYSVNPGDYTSARIIW